MTHAQIRSAADRRARLREIVAELSFKQGDFTLTSGRSSGLFFDMKKTMLDPEGSALLTAAILDLLRDRDVDCIGGLELGAVPMVAQVCQASYPDQPVKAFIVRKRAKGHGTDQVVEGYLHGTAVVFEDVTTTGGSALQAVIAARTQGCTVKTVITIVDRLEGAGEAMTKDGIELVSIFTRDDFVT